MLQRSFDQVMHVARTPAHDHGFVQVVMAATQGDVYADVRCIEVSDGPEFRTALPQAYERE